MSFRPFSLVLLRPLGNHASQSQLPLACRIKKYLQLKGEQLELRLGDEGEKGEAPEGVLFGSQQLPVGETPGPEVVLWLGDVCGNLITLCLWDCVCRQSWVWKYSGEGRAACADVLGMCFLPCIFVACAGSGTRSVILMTPEVKHWQDQPEKRRSLGYFCSYTAT